MSTEERLLIVEEVAQRLRVKPVTVRRALFAGKIRGNRLGKRWLVPESAVKEYLARTEHNVPMPDKN